MNSTKNSLGHACNAAAWTLTSLSLGTSYRVPVQSINANRQKIVLLTHKVFVALRVTSRTLLDKGRFGWDDAFMLLAAAVVVAANIILSVNVSAGMGQHIWDLSHEAALNASSKVPILSSMVLWAFVLPKFSILTLIQRIFSIPKHTLLAFWLLCVLNACLSLIGGVLCFRLCSPTARQWDPANVPGRCLPYQLLPGFIFASAGLSACLDLALAIYPQFLIAKLNMPVRKKALYGAALGLGSLAFVMSVVKLVQLVPTFTQLADDFTHAAVKSSVFALLEADILIITACLPTLAPVYRHILSKTKRGPHTVKDRVSHERLVGTVYEGQDHRRVNHDQDAYRTDDISLEAVSRDLAQTHGQPVHPASMNVHQPSTERGPNPVLQAPHEGILKTVEIEQTHDRYTGDPQQYIAQETLGTHLQ